MSTSDHQLQSARAKVGDIDVAFDTWGSGPPVVLIHGLAEDRGSWAPVREALRGHRCYAYDLRGHGETSVGEALGSLAQLAGDLNSFIESQCGPARCIGYSLGGTIVLAAAAERPDLITGAVVSGTSTVVGRAAAAFFDERIAMVQADRPAFAEALRRDTAAQIVTSGQDLDAIAARRLRAVGDGAGYINAARAMQGVHKTPLTPQLAAIRCRVAVIGGAEDAFCPRRAADIMLAELADGHFNELPECGHLMTIDQPRAYGQALARGLGTGAT